MARCLVIGANGFLGSHLADALANANHEVTAFDRFSRGFAVFSHPKITIAKGDFLSESDLRSALNGQDYVFHFLSTTTPISVDDEPLLDIQTNVLPSVSLIQLAKEAGIERFYYASSGGTIYGPEAYGRCKEEDPRLPLSPYGIGKMTVESYLDYFATKHGFQSISLRIANPFGPRQNTASAQGFIPIALERIRQNQNVVRFGEGLMVRDYIYVEDLIARIIRMVDHQPVHHVYNLGSGKGNSVNEILDAIRQVTGVDFSIEQRHIPPTFIDTVVLDTGRYDAEFGVHVDTSILDGIRATWEYLNERSTGN